MNTKTPHALTTFQQLWVGDRFTNGDTLWTKLDGQTARRHSPESISLGNSGVGYIWDTICSFDQDDLVVFCAVNHHDALCAALEGLLECHETPEGTKPFIFPLALNQARAVLAAVKEGK